MQDGGKGIAVRALCLRRLNRRRHRRNSAHARCGIGRRGHGSAEVTKTAFEFFDALLECPLEALCIRHTRFQLRASLICLTQESFEFCHVGA